MMNIQNTAAAPKFSGLQMIQIHGDKSAFPDHASFRWVPYLPADEVQIFNDTAWGDHTPGHNGTVIDHPTTTFKNKDVAVLSAKMNVGVLPGKDEVKTVLQKVIDASGLPEGVKDKFKRLLDASTFMARVNHSINGAQVTYDGDGNLKEDRWSHLAKANKVWNPENFHKFDTLSHRRDSIDLSFETHPSILRWD